MIQTQSPKWLKLKWLASPTNGVDASIYSCGVSVVLTILEKSLAVFTKTEGIHSLLISNSHICITGHIQQFYSSMISISVKINTETPHLKWSQGALKGISYTPCCLHTLNKRRALHLQQECYYFPTPAKRKEDSLLAQQQPSHWDTTTTQPVRNCPHPELLLSSWMDFPSKQHAQLSTFSP